VDRSKTVNFDIFGNFLCLAIFCVKCMFIMLLLQDTESLLSRQSLYVKFDPLVEKRKSINTGKYCDLKLLA